MVSWAFHIKPDFRYCPGHQGALLYRALMAQECIGIRKRDKQVATNQQPAKTINQNANQRYRTTWNRTRTTRIREEITRYHTTPTSTNMSLKNFFRNLHHRVSCHHLGWGAYSQYDSDKVLFALDVLLERRRGCREGVAQTWRVLVSIAKVGYFSYTSPHRTHWPVEQLGKRYTRTHDTTGSSIGCHSLATL